MNEFSHNYRIASAETSDMQFVTTSLRSQNPFLHLNSSRKMACCLLTAVIFNRLFYGEIISFCVLHQINSRKSAPREQRGSIG